MRRSLSIGINYVGTPHELGGCVNDARAWQTFLAKQSFGAYTLLEKEATTVGMRKALKKFVGSLEANDVGVITYSGHGTWLPDKSGDENDGRDEAFVPYDVGKNGKNLILDDEINTIFEAVLPSATLVFITDCCHSGTIYRMLANESAKRLTYRFLPPANLLTDTKLVSSMNRAYGQPNRKRAMLLSNVIHFSGCRDNEYSIDAEINGVGCGAFTYYAIEAFATTVAAKRTYNDAFAKIRKMLPSSEFPQTPQLNATTSLKRRKIFS